MVFTQLFCFCVSTVLLIVISADRVIKYPSNNPIVFRYSNEGGIIYPGIVKETTPTLPANPRDNAITYPKIDTVLDTVQRKLKGRDSSSESSESSENSSENSRERKRRKKERDRRPNRRFRNGGRVCERKYIEYVSRIFRNDEETIADADDIDFDGRTLARPAEYPHMAALGFVEAGKPVDYKCGGSLISENFVITAAHCTNVSDATPTKVRIGDLNLMVEETYLEPQIRNIKTIYNHPDYKSTSYYHDIALLELDSAVNFTEFVRPIRLHARGEVPVNATASAMGYGSTSFGKVRTNRLTNFNLTIITNELCNEQMPPIPEAADGIIASQVCARDYALGRDTCQGDSGGPLQLNVRGRRRRNRMHYQLLGITSYGLYCRSPYPSVYTRITNYIDWIERLVWPQET